MKERPRRVGIIGLGTMGGIMARSLVDAGHAVFGHDPVPACRARLRSCGGRPLASSAEVAAAAEVLICSLPSSAALYAVVAELKQAGAPAAPQLVIETSTLALADKVAAAAALRRQGRQMVDAPISGTATPDPQQTWIMYLGGTRAACREAAALARAFTLDAPHIGPMGTGTKLKFAANHLVAIYNVAYAEMVTLCRRMGLDPAVALRHLGHSPYLGTGAMRLRVPFMIERRYQPATMKMALWQKDMQVIGAMARSVRSPTPLLDACASIYDEALAMGLGEADTAAAAEVLERAPVLRTPDGRYIVVRGRLWRAMNPHLEGVEREDRVQALMNARRRLKGETTDAERARARAAVQAAKEALGERGPVWWTDGAPDYNRRMAKNTPYAAWFAALGP